MCRLAALAGAATPLSRLLYEAPHSLEVQAYAPRQQLSGHVNVDGTGVAWWQDGDPNPLRYVSDRPPWADPNLADLSRRLSSGMQVAVVRSATPGLPLGPSSAPPLVFGRLALAHNGYVEGFRASCLRPLLESLPDDLISRLDVVTDTALVALVLVHEGGADGDLPGAVRRTLERVSLACAPAAGVLSLNLVAADGEWLVATRFARRREADTLHLIEGGASAPGGVTLASEPLDPNAPWRPVPPDTLVVVDPSGTVETTSLREIG